MSSNAETLARVILEIERILGDYLEPTSDGVHNASLTIEQILLEMDSNDAVGIAERVLAGFLGPMPVK